MILTGIFGVFLKTLSQPAAPIQKDEDNYNNDNDENDNDNRINSNNYRTKTRLGKKISQTFNRFPEHKK